MRRWYNGPWRIIDECVETRHNTLSASRIRKGTKCVCPHAIELSNKYNENRRIVGQRQHGRDIVYAVRKSSVDENGTVLVRSPAYMVKIDGYRIPDLSGALCFTKFGRKVMDSVSLRQVAGHKDTTEAARNICSGCIRLEECNAWITVAENPAGSWGGIYAGRTSYERRRENSRQVKPGIS